MSPRLSRLSGTLFVGALLLAGTAHANPHRLVVLDFDGPRTLADTGRDAVVRALGHDNDLVSPKTWLDAHASAARTSHGPTAWSKAAQRAHVDAVVEGWVQEDGRQRGADRTITLTVIVTDASDGKELDQLTLKLGPNGAFTDDTQRRLRDGLDDRLDWIESTATRIDPKPRDPIGNEDPAAPAAPPATTPAFGPQPATPPTEDKPATQPKPTDVAATDTAAKDAAVLTALFGGRSSPSDTLPPIHRVPHPTPRFRIAGGPGWRSRSLTIGAEEQGGVTQYSGVSDKSIGVDAAFYPFPWKRTDGQLSGIGFSFGVDQSLGSTVTFDDLETVGEYAIDQHGWNAAVHYRAPLSSYFTIDGEVGYGNRTYNIDDAPETFEVPNTAYHYLHGGAHLDMTVTDRASIGFGGNYFHVLDSGDLSSVDWYGPGSTGGFKIDGNFIVPLPARMFVRGELAFTRFKTSFDGVGQITEDEGVYDAVDSTVAANVKVGIEF